MVDKGEFIEFASNLKVEGDLILGIGGPSTTMQIIIELCIKIKELETRIIELEKR